MNCPNCAAEMIESTSKAPTRRGCEHTCPECGYGEIR